MTGAPNSRRNLDEAIRRVAGPAGYVAARSAMANAVVAQMLRDGVVKGGSALKLRFGDAVTRYTNDLDAARAGSLQDFVEALESQLAEGWEGFSGRVVPREPASPAGVPARYVMQPFDVKLSYNEKPWVTVPLEVGHDEVGDADVAERGIAADVAALFEKVGLPVPADAPLMPLPHQIAQKLHGASEPGSSRAHDLVDLQVIMGLGDVDLAATREVCVRLFAYRGQQAWPPTLAKNEGWDRLYAEQSRGLDVLGTADEAVTWANGLVSRIDSAR